MKHIVNFSGGKDSTAMLIRMIEEEMCIRDSIIDAGRTYAFNLYGRTFTSSGVILDQNAYRYVDFWAGKNM